MPSDCASAKLHTKAVNGDVLDAQNSRGSAHAMLLHFHYMDP